MTSPPPTGHVSPETTLADLVLGDPRRARLLGGLGLDYCCRGNRTLAVACAERGLDVGTLLSVFEADHGDDSARDGERDWRTASTSALIDHIVTAHHDWLRQQLPQLAETIATVARVHGGDDRRLGDLARVYHRLSDELLAHLEREEQLLFPACCALDAGEAPADADALLAELEDDHADVGRMLVALRELADDFSAETARCSTHARLLEGLRALEQDVHEHVHEENNVLFPRIRSRLAA